MKSTQRLKKLVFIFIALVVLFFIFKGRTNYTDQSQSAFPTLKKENIKKITLFSKTEKREIVSKGGEWFVIEKKAEFPADEERIADIIWRLSKLTFDEVVSESSMKYAQFEVDGRRKIDIIEGLKNVKSTIFIGKVNTYGRNYFRIDGQKSTYIAPEDLTIIFENLDYRNLKPHLVKDEEKVSEIKLVWGGEDISLVKKGAEWHFPSSEKANRQAISYLINEITTLKGTDIKFKKDINLRLQDAELSIFLKESGKDKKAKAFKKDETSYYFLVESSKYIFQIPNVYISSLKKQNKDLIN